MKRQSVSPFKDRSTRAAARSPQWGGRGRRYAGVAMLFSVALAACSTPDPQAIDYKSSGRQPKAPSLAAPPDLMSEQRARFDAPANGEASLSGYQPSPGTPVAVQQVLPSANGLHIERDGSERWLVVSSIPPAQLWERIRAFWQEQGFFLIEDSQQRGVMQTDWRETRAKMDQGIIRNTLTMAVNNGYVSAERNRFRTRIEAGPHGQTYVFISQQGLHEVLTGPDNDNSQWQPKPNDPGMEADYLGRLERSLAQGPKPSVMDEAAAASAASAAAAKAASPDQTSAVPPTPLPAGATPAQDGITLSTDYDQAWARVGRGLDRANFTVDDRDRTRGLYFIRYVDPNDLGTAAQGFWNQLFHGKKEKEARQYQINVRAVTEDQTQVVIRDANGNPDGSPLAQRIMRLLVSAM